MRLAPLLDSELRAPDRHMSELARWCQTDYPRTVALVSASVTLLYQYNATPGTVRVWGQAMEQANIRAHKNPTLDRRIH